jgi:hypothetical protein
MGIFDAFRKEEVTGSKVLVCQLGPAFTTKFDEYLDSELRGAVAHNYDVLHLFCDASAAGVISDPSGDRITGTELLKAAADAGVKLLWIASDNAQEAYDAGFKTKGLKLNVVLTLRRLGPNTSFFLDNLFSKMAAGETLAKAWQVAANPEGKSVQPDVPHTITALGRGAVVLR